MNLLRDAPLWAQLLLAAILVAAATQDLVQRRISNLLCLAVILIAIPAAVAVGPAIGLWQNGVSFALLLALGVPLFAAGWLGGGDVKLFAALGLWVDLSTLLPLLACILIAGGVLAIASLFIRGPRAVRRSGGLPYGIAIAVGTAIIMLPPVLSAFEPKAAGPLDLKAARNALPR